VQFVKATGRRQPGEQRREVEAGVEAGVEIEQYGENRRELRENPEGKRRWKGGEPATKL
jgi:hypothetical protein